MSLRRYEDQDRGLRAVPGENSKSPARPDQVGSAGPSILKCGFSMIPKTLPKGSNVGHRGVLAAAELAETGEGRVGVLDPPVDADTARAGRSLGGIGIEPQLEAADVEADVERLVEVRVDAEDGAVPLLRLVEVGHPVERGAQAEDGLVIHDLSSCRDDISCPLDPSFSICDHLVT